MNLVPMALLMLMFAQNVERVYLSLDTTTGKAFYTSSAPNDLPVLCTNEGCALDESCACPGGHGEPTVDVPAIQGFRTWATLRPCTQDEIKFPSGTSQSVICTDVHYDTWTCPVDKSTHWVLWEATDGTHWCHRVQP
jgi:hypothetical protein